MHRSRIGSSSEDETGDTHLGELGRRLLLLGLLLLLGCRCRLLGPLLLLRLLVLQQQLVLRLLRLMRLLRTLRTLRRLPQRRGHALVNRAPVRAHLPLPLLLALLVLLLRMVLDGRGREVVRVAGLGAVREPLDRPERVRGRPCVGARLPVARRRGVASGGGIGSAASAGRLRR